MARSVELHHRFRPVRFSQVIGQDPVVRALCQELDGDRVASAYLLGGPPGTGKSSVAMILAMALNCPSREGHEPCGSCSSCVSVLEHRSLDVKEIHAGLGYEAVRGLVWSLSLTHPVSRRVCMIDCPELITAISSGEMSASLDNPPAHVVFILTSNRADAVHPRLRSRTQEHRLRSLPVEVVVDRLREVASRAGLPVDERVIAAAATHSPGDLRDALLTMDSMLLSGDVPKAGPLELVEAIATLDRREILVAIADAHGRGLKPMALAVQTLSRLRDVFLVQSGAGRLVASSKLTEAESAASAMTNDEAIRAMDAISDVLKLMEAGVEGRVSLEIALVGLCTAADADDGEGLERA